MLERNGGETGEGNAVGRSLEKEKKKVVSQGWGKSKKGGRRTHPELGLDLEIPQLSQSREPLGCSSVAPLAPQLSAR